MNGGGVFGLWFESEGSMETSSSSHVISLSGISVH